MACEQTSPGYWSFYQVGIQCFHPQESETSLSTSTILLHDTFQQTVDNSQQHSDKRCYPVKTKSNSTSHMYCILIFPCLFNCYLIVYLYNYVYVLMSFYAFLSTR